MRTTTIIAAVVASTFAVIPSASAEWDPIRYCETSIDTHGVSRTWIETDLVEFEVRGMTMRTTPIRGDRWLVESKVKRGPVVIDCRVRVVNGHRTALITTRGGAEWAVTNPVAVR